MTSLRADMWVVCLRAGTNHRGVNTTGHIEGYHAFIKDLAKCLSALAKRLDRLLYLLTDTVEHHYVSKAIQRHHGEFLSARTFADLRCDSEQPSLASLVHSL